MDGEISTPVGHVWWVSLDGLSLMSETSKRMPQRTDRDGESAGGDRRGGGGGSES